MNWIETEWPEGTIIHLTIERRGQQVTVMNVMEGSISIEDSWWYKRLCTGDVESDRT